MGTRLIFTCLKNEGPFLLEWVNYHLSLGFDRFVFFTNDCGDETAAMAERLAELGLGRHVPNKPGKRGPQWTALNTAELGEELAASDWAIHLDIDEFLNVESLDILLGQIGDADAISVPWRFFGSNGCIDFKNLPVMSQFTRCSPYPIDFPRQALMFKTLYRPGTLLDRPGVHAPRLARGKGINAVRWLNGDGRPVSGLFSPLRPTLHGPDAGVGLAQINHYAVKSRAAFMVKAARGLPNHGHVPVDLSYWVRRNFNDIEDRRLADRTIPDDARLDDPVLREMHARSVTWYREKIGDILATPEGIELFSAIAVTGDSVVPPPGEIRSLYRALGRVFGGRKGQQ